MDPSEYTEVQSTPDTRSSINRSCRIDPVEVRYTKRRRRSLVVRLSKYRKTTVTVLTSSRSPLWVLGNSGLWDSEDGVRYQTSVYRLESQFPNLMSWVKKTHTVTF